MGNTTSATFALRAGMDGSYFSAALSRLRRKLSHELGPAARPYLIDNGGRKPYRYQLDLAPDTVMLSTTT